MLHIHMRQAPRCSSSLAACIAKFSCSFVMQPVSMSWISSKMGSVSMFVCLYSSTSVSMLMCFVYLLISTSSSSSSLCIIVSSSSSSSSSSIVYHDYDYDYGY